MTAGRAAKASAPTPTVPYAELHCHSSFSFLDGASHPEELVRAASELGLEALALTDHDGLYGVVRFFEAARAAGVRTVFGSEVTLPARSDRRGPAPARTRIPDPQGSHLLLLARDPEGYRRLAKSLSEAHLAGGEKGRPLHELDHLGESAGGHFVALTGCRKGAVPAALVDAGPAAAARELDKLVSCFGRENVAVELWDHGDPLDLARNDALAEIATRRGVPVVATNVVHYALPKDRRLATVLAAVRSGKALDEIDGWLPAAGMAYLRTGTEQARRFARYPGAVAYAAELGRACAFDLKLVAPKLPDFPVPPGHSETSYLRQLVEERGAIRYGPRSSPKTPGAWEQIDHELQMIEELNFPGYFLVVFDIVEFCRRNDIFCQGRGSAASSAVCYVLGITNADAVSLGLLFERFLSPERDGPPDIDVDIESGRREEVIQYVYERYGRERAALVGVVVTYRARSAVRDTGKAFGHSQGQVDKWSKQVDRWGTLGGQRHVNSGDRSGHWSWWSGAVAKEVAEQDRRRGRDNDKPGRDDVAREPGTAPWTSPGPGGDDSGVPLPVLAMATEIEGFPRHMGIHPGGMVICDRPVSEVCPVEWARMENRTVLQWDKDDCAAVGLVKFDLLGLGMLEAIHRAVNVVKEHHGVELELATIPQEDEVYEMLCQGDSVGVFQVESRAQMATLPRLKPRYFYDLVVEVALIRPGPIQGGSVHPYIRRRNGFEPVTYLHPIFERCLSKTLGVPLFQEQLMEMAIDAAGFSAAEADKLRQAMGSKRSAQRMEAIRARLFDGMASKGITGAIAEEIWEKLRAFSNFGFPESHSVSFAYLVYVSAWLKLHYPAAFLASLLNSQPMGFWAPHTLVADARRHGVTVLSPDVNLSEAGASLEPLAAGPVADGAGAGASGGRGQFHPISGDQMSANLAAAGGRGQFHPISGDQMSANLAPEPAVRLGLMSVKGIGEELAEKIAAGRPYRDLEDLARRTGANRTILETLATAGAVSSLVESPAEAHAGTGRRTALWAAGAAATASDDRIPGTILGTEAPELSPMDEVEVMSADLQTLGLSPASSPVQLMRPELERLGAVPIAQLMGVPDGTKVTIAGIVTHRQRPATAGGTTFFNIEDETGLMNVICSAGLWVRYRKAARSAVVMLVKGRLERADGAHPKAPSGANIVGEYLEDVGGALAVTRSRDFR